MRRFIQLLALVGALVFGLAGQHAVHASPPPPHIECSTTFWETIASAGPIAVTDGTMSVGFYKLEDTVNLGYCGQLKTATYWNQSLGSHTYTAAIWYYNTSTQIASHTTGSIVGSNNSYTTVVNSPASGHCYEGVGWQDNHQFELFPFGRVCL